MPASSDDNLGDALRNAIEQWLREHPDKTAGELARAWRCGRPRKK